MNKKASVLIIILWILVILTMLAVSTGHRLSLGLKLNKYQRDGIKAFYLARAGLNLAVSELNKDNSVNGSWLSDESLFKKVTLTGNQDEYASVSYTAKDPASGEDKIIYGAVDEESRINVNRIDPAGQNQLTELFIYCGMSPTEAADLSGTAVDWIDENQDRFSGGTEDTIFKNKPLDRKEELLVIMEYYFKTKSYDSPQERARNLYEAANDLITVYGQRSININTVNRDVLSIVLKALASDDEKDRAVTVTDAIINLRQERLMQHPLDVPFKDAASMDLVFNDPPSDALLDKLKDGSVSTFGNPTYFLIRAAGYCGKSVKNITAVYNRNVSGGSSGFVYWHEN